MNANEKKRNTIGILLIAIVVFLSALSGVSLAAPTGPAIKIEVISLECGPKVNGNTVQLIYCTAKVRITNTGNAAFNYLSYGYVENSLQVGFAIFEAILPGQVVERTIHIPANVSGERSINLVCQGEGVADGKPFVVFAGVNRIVSCPIPSVWPKPDIKVHIVPNMGISEGGNTYTSFYIQFENGGGVPVSYVNWKYKLTMGTKETTGNHTLWYGIYTGKAVSGNVTLYAPCGDVRIEVEISSHYRVEFPDGQGAREYNLSATDTFVGRAPCACEDAVTVNAEMTDPDTLRLNGNWTFTQNSAQGKALGTWIIRTVEEDNSIFLEVRVPWTTDRAYRGCEQIVKEQVAKAKGKGAPYVDVLFLSPTNETLFYRRFTRAEVGNGSYDCPSGMTRVKAVVPEGYFLSVQSGADHRSIGRKSTQDSMCVLSNEPLIVSLVDISLKLYRFRINGGEYLEGRATIPIEPVLEVSR